MNLRRSSSGLHSLHIFFRVDIVVYCEGGETISFNEATSLVQRGKTLDTFYWASIAELHNSNKTMHFKSVGNKSTLKEIAVAVDEQNITSISVCMDRDYNDYRADQLSGDRLAYTLGYSWESDVVQYPVIETIIKSFVDPGKDQKDVIEEFRLSIRQFAKSLVKWTELDIALFLQDKGCLFHRKKQLSCIDMAAPPQLRLPYFRTRLQELGYTRGPKRVVKLSEAEVLKVSFGKLISRTIFHIFRIVVGRTVQDLRIEYDLFMRLAVSESIKLLKSGSLTDLSAHITQHKEVFS